MNRSREIETVVDPGILSKGFLLHEYVPASQNWVDRLLENYRSMEGTQPREATLGEGEQHAFNYPPFPYGD